MPITNDMVINISDIKHPEGYVTIQPGDDFAFRFNGKYFEAEPIQEEELKSILDLDESKEDEPVSNGYENIEFINSLYQIAKTWALLDGQDIVSDIRKYNVKLNAMVELDRVFFMNILNHDYLWHTIRKWQAENDKAVHRYNSKFIPEMVYVIRYRPDKDSVIAYATTDPSPNDVLFYSEEACKECIAYFFDVIQYDMKMYHQRKDSKSIQRTK